jgi:hypothetical protein
MDTRVKPAHDGGESCVIARSPCDEAIQLAPRARKDWIASLSLAMTMLLHGRISL